MLVLFVVTIGYLQFQKKATEDELEKIQAIQESVNKIDTTYFKYKGEYKKHILNITVQFGDKNDNIYSNEISISARDSLVKAGNLIVDFLNKAAKDSLTKTAKYLLIIEGQASKDGYWDNDGLSYRRALSLKYFWKKNNILLNQNNNCEVIIAGSGEEGIPREEPDKYNKKNQRFLIHIIPKPGIFNNSK